MTDIRGKLTHHGTYVEMPKLYRTITIADTNGAAAIEAIPEMLDMEHRQWMHLNVLHIQTIVPATVTAYTVEVWGTVDESVTPALTAGAERWSKITEFTGLSRSSVQTLFNVLPGKLKVLVTNVTGALGTGAKVIALGSA